MAKKGVNSERTKLYKALKVLGEQITKRQHTKTYQKLWDKINKATIDKGEDPLDLDDLASQYTQQDYETSPRDDNMNTQPANVDLDEEQAKQVIADYERRIDEIYRNTITWIEDNKKGVGHEKGQFPSIADYRRSEIDDAYWTLKAQFQELQVSGIPAIIIAQAISNNVELDYTIAVKFLPPSDIEVEFEETVQQLFAIMSQIDKEAKELAIEEEEKYTKGSNYQ